MGTATTDQPQLIGDALVASRAKVPVACSTCETARSATR